MKISVLINSKDRPQVLARCLRSVLAQEYDPFEVLVLDDASANCQLADELAGRFDDKRLHVTRVEESQGVARGRNLLMQQATGDLFVVIDDDAYFADEQALRHLVDDFESRPSAGIVACKIIKHAQASAELQVPFKQRTLRKQPAVAGQRQLVSYFIGAGHAIRREVIDTCGPYSNELTFGEEELDLSYRAIEAGFEIYYLPHIVIHHFPQPSVVISGGRRRPELYHHVQNRLFIAYKYLPWRYIPVYLGIWLARYGTDALKAGALRDFIGGLLAGSRQLKQVQRNRLGRDALAYLQVNYGRLWY